VSLCDQHDLYGLIEAVIKKESRRAQRHAHEILQFKKKIPVYTSFLKVELDSFDPSTSVLCAQLFSSVCTSLLKANWIAEDGFDS
jgi:hypothetical protein